jgi:hypothetical protein
MCQSKMRKCVRCENVFYEESTAQVEKPGFAGSRAMQNPLKLVNSVRGLHISRSSVLCVDLQ